MEDAVVLTGTVVREERLFTAELPVVSLLAVSGERVAAGTPLAILCEDGEEFFRAELLLRLRREAEEPRTKDRRAALGELRRTLARRDFPALPDAARSAAAVLALPAGTRTLSGEIAALERAGAESAVVFAPAPGVFVAGDGGEVWGRLVTGQRWRFESSIPCERLAAGDAVTLRLPFGREVPAQVESDDPLTLRGDRALEALLDAGPVTVTVVLGRWEGLRLPVAALRQAEDGICVLRAAGALSAPAEVTVLCRRGEEALVVSDDLRAGMEILLP